MVLLREQIKALFCWKNQVLTVKFWSLKLVEISGINLLFSIFTVQHVQYSFRVIVTMSNVFMEQ